MDINEQWNLIQQVLQHEPLGVIASMNGHNQPQAALVGIAATDTFHIIFRTNITTRKYQNIQQQPRVALVIGTSSEKKITVQYEGLVKELTGADLEHYREIYLTKHAWAHKLVLAEDERMFLVTPKWIRYTDYASSPRVIFELDQFE